MTAPVADLDVSPPDDTVPAWVGFGETVIPTSHLLGQADTDAGQGEPEPGRYAVFAHKGAVAYICIGNSDDRLTQEQWSLFVAAVRRLVRDDELRLTLVFEGFAPPDVPYQNACWGVILPSDCRLVDLLRWRLSRLAGLYGQDSVSWAEAGCTEFLGPYGRAAGQVG